MKPTHLSSHEDHYSEHLQESIRELALTLDTAAITPPSTATSLGNPSSVRALADGALNIHVPNNSAFNAPLLLNGDGWSSEATGARTCGIINWNASTYSGAFTSIVPSPGAGLAWDPSTLTTVGTLRIVEGGVNYSTNITAVLIDDTTLQLSWPETHRGWYMQSNSVDVANSAAWFNVEGSQTGTNLNITINPSIPRVFYRLKSEP